MSKKERKDRIDLMYFTLRVITLYHQKNDLSTHFVEFILTFFTPRVKVIVR